MAKLKNEQYERFCQGYIQHLNGARAYRDAGFSAKGAKDNAGRLLKNKLVQERLAELRSELETATAVETQSIVNELATVAFSTIEGIVEVEDGEITITNTKQMTAAQKASIKAVRKTSMGVSIELHPKVTALSELSKIYGLTTDFNTSVAAVRRFGINLQQEDDGTWYVNNDIPAVSFNRNPFQSNTKQQEG